MSDERWSREQQEIEASAKANPPTRVCGARRGPDVCELGPGHIGNHRVTLADNTKRYWWDVVDAATIEREAKKWEPEAKKKDQPVHVSAKPEKDEGSK